MANFRAGSFATMSFSNRRSKTAGDLQDFGALLESIEKGVEKLAKESGNRVKKNKAEQDLIGHMDTARTLMQDVIPNAWKRKGQLQGMFGAEGEKLLQLREILSALDEDSSETLKQNTLVTVSTIDNMKTAMDSKQAFGRLKSTATLNPWIEKAETAHDEATKELVMTGDTNAAVKHLADARDALDTAASVAKVGSILSGTLDRMASRTSQGTAQGGEAVLKQEMESIKQLSKHMSTTIQEIMKDESKGKYNTVRAMSRDLSKSKSKLRSQATLEAQRRGVNGGGAKVGLARGIFAVLTLAGTAAATITLGPIGGIAAFGGMGIGVVLAAVKEECCDAK